MMITSGVWRMLGLLTFLDPPRPDTKETIERARGFGVAVKMITGDHLLIAKETSRVLGNIQTHHLPYLTTSDLCLTGLGQFVRSADGLPLLDTETKEKPPDLSKNFGSCLS